ncbi:MAG: hypothetical protein H6741_26895 [Alphaproteobacteria bacterium]|nr:hypothetical protein [Alphaproteobacteria bacterium]MCB9796339.1 hypothetical protein [Alphaproteobacteria bacterium]
MTLLLSLLACAGGGTPAGDDFLATGELTVTGGAAGTEYVELDLLGVSQVQGEDALIFSLTDESGVYALILVVEGVTGPGDYTPTKVHYHEGQQVLFADAATCTLSLSEGSDVAQPWEGAFSCEGLVAERGGEPWSFSDGSFSGGASTTLASREERMQASGYSFHLELLPEGGEAVDERDLTRAWVIPWRNAEVQVLFEDGPAEAPEDLLVSLYPDAGRLEAHLWTREATTPGSALQVSLSATDLPITAALNGSDEEVSGEQVEVQLWEDVGDVPFADKERVVLIY